MCRFIASAWSKGMKIVAVDVGYSHKDKSCGCCITGNKGVDLTFGDAVQKVASLVKNNNEALLVIEAPLSTYHNNGGNPDFRFEDEEGHPWYCGPGATVLLAAKRLLEQISSNLGQREIRIAEAFYARKKDHAEVASFLANEFGKGILVEAKKPREQIVELIDSAPNIYDFSLFD